MALSDVWEHYTFTEDVEYLKNIGFPIMKEAALFWLDYLVENEDGYLISMPSYSPEHGGISKGTAMDHQMVFDLFTNCIAACNVLNIEDKFKQEVAEALKKIYPQQIENWGQLQEWMEDVDDPENKHRHVSHLFALHPGKQIRLQYTPELAEAAKVSLNARGDSGAGWSLAWKCNFWARLLDGDRAYKMLRTLLRPTDELGYNYANGGGTYSNLFCAHPPFQLDGNFGSCAGIAEMLLQSHTKEIHLLPALPAAWQNGTITGLCARGGFVVDMKWENGDLIKVRILSKCGNKCNLRYREKTVNFPTETGEIYKFDKRELKRVLRVHTD